MKKRLQWLIIGALLFTCLTGCSKVTEDFSHSENSEDLYVGEYVSIGEIDGEMKIEKSENEYKIFIEFYDLIEIIATGEEADGTLFYEGEDEYGNEITGNIEEYGEDYPVRVEFYGDDLFDEIEFERK